MKVSSFGTTLGCILLGLLSLQTARAQDDAANSSDSEVQSIENMLEKNVPQGSPTVDFNTYVPLEKTQSKKGSIDYSEIEHNRNLSDTVIVQKIYMPKTHRVQLFGGFTYAMNDAFFHTMGAQLRAGYHFNETWGVEATSFLLTSQDTTEKKDLLGKQSLDVQSLTTPKSLLGVNAYFSNIYGKMALEERRIIPFELYQTVGIGQITTNPTSTSTAFYFGLGNIFSISKNSEIRADLSWFFYNGKTINGENQSTNTIFLTIGYGRFVPEARSR